MYTVEIVAEGQMQVDATGKPIPCPVGTVIIDSDAWRLCMPGFRNAPPIATPGDDETAQKVAQETAARAPRKAAQIALLQRRIDEFAKDTKRFRIDTVTGTFLRRNGELAGNLTNVERHVIETAESYGLRPELPPTPAAEETPSPATK